MRLIDADTIFNNKVLLVREECYDAVHDVIERINNAPTVDAVPVVRCKDCKHSEHWYRDKRRCFLWREAGIDVFENGYCNYAERRTDETD